MEGVWLEDSGAQKKSLVEVLVVGLGKGEMGDTSPSTYNRV